MGRRRTRSLWAVDNLEGLSSLSDGSVALAYLDPPFNSGRAYDAIFSSRASGSDHRAEAFADSWRWSDATDSLLGGLQESLSHSAAEFVADLARALRYSDLAAYLVMMAPRLAAVHRALSDAGSVYVHCDPTASHYLKLLLDQVFGQENFRNEIIWRRTHAHSSSRRFGPVHDVLLFYSKGPRYTWNPAYSEYRAEYIRDYYTHEDEHGRYQLITCTAPGDRTGTRAHYEWRGHLPPPGRHWAWKQEQMEAFDAAGRLAHSTNGVPRLKRYVEEGAGVPLQDLWIDINRLDAHSDERVGYDTQKPLPLLDRIISASSNPGDLVLDPFCGSGTTCVAAERLKRSWLGMDSSLLATSIALARVRPEVHLADISLKGFPSDRQAALRLLRTEPRAFGFWGTSMLATLADRKVCTDSLATGAGRLRVGGKQVQVFSWVPLRDSADPVMPKTRLGRLSKVGFFLRRERAHRELRSWLETRLETPLHEVGISDLVEPETLRRGFPSTLLNATTAVVTGALVGSDGHGAVGRQ